jgi:hypothetical protein
MPAGSRKVIVWGFPGPTAKHKSLVIEGDGDGQSGLFRIGESQE